MAGLLDFLSTPSGIGLLSGVAGYAAGARRGTPVNNVGRGLTTGLFGYQQAQDAIKQEQDNALAKQYKQLQMDEMQRKMEKAKGEQTWRANLPQMMDKAQTKVTPFQPDDPFNQGPAAFGEVYGGDKHGQQTDALMANVQQGDPQALQQYLMQPESPYADKLMEKQLFPSAADYKVVDGTLVQIGSEGVKPVYSAPVKEDWNKPFLSDGKPNPAYQEYSTNKARAGATNVSVGPTRVENITTQESEGSKVYGRGLGEMQVDIQKQGFTAPTRIANLDRMGQLLEGVDSGRFSGAGLEAARFAKSFGLNVDPKLGNKQAAEALAIEMALQMREPGSGPMTDKDFDNYLNTVPNLAKTAAGRKEITATLKAKARRDMEISKMARAYAKQNRGVVDDDFLDQVSEYMAQNPVVPIARDYGGGWKMEKVK